MKSITVIGGGVIGLCSAWRLAQAGWHVTLLERAGCGQGASQASLGALMPYAPWQNGDLPEQQRQSLFDYPQFVAELFQYTGVDPIYRPLGRLQPIQNEKQYEQMQKGVEEARKSWPWHGVQPVQELLSSEQCRKLEPHLDVGEYGALMCRLTAHVHPHALAAALRSACMKAGVDIKEQCAVDELRVKDGQVYGLKTGYGPLAVDKVLIAAGAWSSSLLPSVEMEEKIVPLKGQALMLHPEKQMLRHLVRGLGLYLVPLSGRRLWVGATKEKEAGFDTEITQGAREDMMDKVERLVPELALVKVEKQWSGFRPQSESRKPIVSKVKGYDNLYLASGHAGIGICMTPIVGRQVVQLLES